MPSPRNGRCAPREVRGAETLGAATDEGPDSEWDDASHNDHALARGPRDDEAWPESLFVEVDAQNCEALSVPTHRGAVTFASRLLGTLLGDSDRQGRTNRG